MKNPKIIVALDYSHARDALAIAALLDPALCRVKVGKELFTASGPAVVEALRKKGFDVFLDLKFHDIPHTVSMACRAAAQLGVWMVNVHASGGRAMMQAAREAMTVEKRPPLLVAVTVLTSLAATDLKEVGMEGDPQAAVLRLALLAQSAGLDGVVCSAQEASVLGQACGPSFCLVTPGIRLADGGSDDQKRIMTPQAALQAGAHYLVIGRPITQAKDPLAMLQHIDRQMHEST